MALQRGNAVSSQNTMVTEKIAISTVILHVYNNILPSQELSTEGLKSNNNNNHIYIALSVVTTEALAAEVTFPPSPEPKLVLDLATAERCIVQC